MKLAYVTTYDVTNIHAWSGSGTFILSSLKSTGLQIETIGNLKLSQSSILLSKVKHRFYKIIQSRNYLMDREPLILKYYSAQVEKLLHRIDYDLVFSPGSIPIAYLKSDKPIVLWSDATFAGMIDFYPEFSNLCKESIKNGNKMEQAALSNCCLAIFSSDWAANTAIQNYDVDPRKIKVVPFGANLELNHNLDDIKNFIKNKSIDTCKLLFIGVDWNRKGGDKALEVAKILNIRGINTELHIVGCIPPPNQPDFVKFHGFISKKDQNGSKFLERILQEAHFLIVPSKAECFGVVFAEASSFGLPSLATKVGGISTVIRDGINGKTFHLTESAEKYCDYIEKMFLSKEMYTNLAMTSFREYSERLNWLVAGNQVRSLIEEFCF